MEVRGGSRPQGVRVIEDVHHHHQHHERKKKEKAILETRSTVCVCVCVQNKEEEAMCAQRSAKVGNTFSSSSSSRGE